jgi:FKBP-type peptidyl-prolyl cis-trans isomerase FkpA
MECKNTGIVITHATEAGSHRRLACAVLEAILGGDIRMTRYLFIAFSSLLAFTIIMTACSGKTPSELKINDIVAGTGAQAVKESKVTVHYTGWLYKNGHRGKKFDSSLDSNQPFTFTLGAGEVIEGWDRGVEGMRVGGKRELIIPSHMGYGKAGAPPSIPPDAVLDFEIQLLDVRH